MKQVLSHQIIKANTSTKRTPLVFLHGLYGFKSNLRGIARSLSSNLNQDRDFILMDLRNHGNSFHSKNMSLEIMTEDIINTMEVMEHLSIDKAIWLGHSLGGKISMLGALHFPSFVAGLIVADIAPIKHDMDRHFHITKVFQSMSMDNIVDKKECIGWLKSQLPEFSTFELQFLLSNLVKDKQSNDWKWRINLQAIENNLDYIAGFNSNGLQYDQHCLFIGGSKANIFPNSDIEMLCANHYLHVEKPKEFTNLVYQYIQNIE